MYLQNRNGIYYFRWRVPDRLRHVYGRREIRQSLRTGNKREAQQQAVVLAAQVLNRHEQPPTALQAPLQPPTGEKLSVLLEVYLEEQERRKAFSLATIKNKRLVFKKLMATIGDQPLKHYGREAAKRFQSRMLSSVSALTFNSYLKHINAFWHWAIAEGFAENNVFKMLSVSDRRKESDFRKAYTLSQLKQLFSPDSYPQITSSNAVNHSVAMYWLPLLGLYTGARLNELAQLYLDDIDPAQRIIHIRATRPDQRIKNKGSERVIPIHSHLLDFGFLKYVNTTKANVGVNGRLFPSLVYSADKGYGDYPSKRWAKYLSKQGFERNSGLTFHSFRHTVANELKQQGVEERYIAAILGHASGGITHNRYGKDYAPETLRPIVERLNYFLPQ